MPNPSRPGSLGLSNQRVASLILGVMFAFALVGLTAYLMTVGIRRQHDTFLPKPQRGSHRFVAMIRENLWAVFLVVAWISGLLAVLLRPRVSADSSLPRRGLFSGPLAMVAAVALLFALLSGIVSRNLPSNSSNDQTLTPLYHPSPADLETLGYLPGDTDVIAVVYVAEILERPAGKDLLARLLMNTPEGGTSTLEKTTGMKLEEINHVVLGLKISDRFTSRWQLILQARRPFDQDKVREALKKERGTQEIKWLSPITLAMAASAKDLNTIPKEPMHDVKHLAPPIQDFLRTRITNNASAWAIGHAPKVEQTAVGFLLAALPAEEQKIVAKIQTLGLYIQLDKEAKLTTEAECVDASAAAGLDGYLEQREKAGIHHSQDGAWVKAWVTGKVEDVEKGLGLSKNKPN